MDRQGLDLQHLNYLLSLVARTITVGMMLAILGPIIRVARRDGRTMRALAWFCGALTCMFLVTWLGGVEEILDFIPDFNLRLCIAEWIWIAYLPLIVALERLRRSL